MPVQLCHQGLAETHDFAITSALGVEVGPSLGATQRKRCQSILEDLLKSEKLENAQVH